MNSRRKGANNERKIAALFTKWTGREFAKTPASGGLQWKSAFSKGDIVCTKEGHYFPFCIEAKFHIKIDFAHLLVPAIQNIQIIDFWNQCKRDASKCNKIPLLFMRYNGLKADFHFLIMEYEYFRFLPYNQREKMQVTMMYWDRIHNYRLLITRSTDFFKTNYKDIKLNAKTYLKEKAKAASKG